MQPAELRTLKRSLEQDRDDCAADIARIERELDAKKEELARLDGWLEYVAGKLQGEPSRAIVARTKADQLTEGGAEAGPATRSEIIASILVEAGKPLKIAEIMELLEAAGHKLSEDRQKAYNSVYVTMTKAKRRFRKDETARWSLIDPSHAERDGQASSPGTERPKYIEVAERLARDQGGTVRISDVADWFIRNGYKEIDQRTHVMSTAYGALGASKNFRRGEEKGVWILVSG